MSVKESLLLARSHVAFIGGLIGAFAMIAYLEGWDWKDFDDFRHGRGMEEIAEPRISIPGAVTELALRETGELDDQMIGWARHAWTYFENNTQPETGLVNSAHQYTSTTLWDTASYLLGLIAVEKLGVIENAEFESRLEQALTSLESLPLVDGLVPNKAYNTQTLEMVDYNNNPTPNGVGWSAIDAARLLVPLQLIVWDHPRYTDKVKNVVSRWDFDEITRDGLLYGSERTETGEIEHLQEGRLGYEQYAAKSLTLFGLDVSEAIVYEDHLKIIEIEDIPIATDDRDFATLGANNYVVSEPYVLDGLEFGFDHKSRELAANVFWAQRERARRLGVLTAVSETQLDRAPYFIYNTVFANGTSWNTITETNEDASEYRTLSTKAALGWYVLFDDEYSDSLFEEIGSLVDPELGFYSGRYEATQEINRVTTANTNGIVLEALAYLQSGPMLQAYRGTLAGKVSDEGEATDDETSLSSGDQPVATEATEESEVTDPVELTQRPVAL